MNSPPPVTVLMPVHNGRRFLREAVESILSQTFGDFEFLIVDDASSDGAQDDLARLTDPRVRLERNPHNLGITRSLNRGLDLARGEFVARMDGDDVAEPKRLQRQVEFLRSHPEVGIVGSSRTIIDESGKTIAIGHAPETDAAIRWKCLLGSPFAHPTVMMRREVLERSRLRYDAGYPAAEDYKLWTQLLSVTRGANLGEPLLRYRLRDGISRTNKAEQLATHDRIVFEAIRAFLPDFPITLDDASQLRGRFGGFSVRDAGMDPSDKQWIRVYDDLRAAFQRRYPEGPVTDVEKPGEKKRFARC